MTAMLSARFLLGEPLDVAHAKWEMAIVYETPREPGSPTPGRDCEACPAPREEHDGWGAARTGCKLSVALVTHSLYRRTT